MIVVAAGKGERFGDDKMLAEARGMPLVALTVARVSPHVDRCVLVARPDQFEKIVSWCPGVTLVEGGPTRTASEVAGLEALHEMPDLVGIHDGARPNVQADLIEGLFAAAAEFGGAIPVVPPAAMIVHRQTLQPIEGLAAAQTPQVFKGRELYDAYRAAVAAGDAGHDTADIFMRHSGGTVAAVPGDPLNLKVTYPEDLERVIPL